MKNRYAKDYRIIEDADKKGRIKESLEYIGPEYSVEADQATVRMLLILAAVGWICFICAMIPKSGAMHQVHIALMYVFAAIPLWLLTQTALFLRRVVKGGESEAAGKEDGKSGVQAEGQRGSKEGLLLKRKEADILLTRFPAAAFFTFLLPAIALVSEGIALALGNGIWPGDAVFTACATGVCAVGLTAYGKRKKIKVREAKGR